MVITDVILTGSDTQNQCFGNSRITINVGGDTFASFAVGVSSDSRDWTMWSSQMVSALRSGIRISPGVVPEIQAQSLYESSCGGGEMDVEYTLSGYYAQP